MEKNYAVPNFGDIYLTESSDASFTENFADKFDKVIATVTAKAKALKELSQSLSYGTYKECYTEIAKELTDKILGLIMENDFEISKISVMPIHSQPTMYSREYSWTSFEVFFHNTNDIVRKQNNFTFGENNASEGIQNEQD